MATTVQFLNEKFEQISLLLECWHLSVQHTSINLANELKRVLTGWNVENKFLMVDSDNASNIKAGIQNKPEWKHFGCFAHTINLVDNDGLKEKIIAKTINRVSIL